MYYHIKEENNLPKALGYSSIVMAILVAIGFFIVFGQPAIPDYGMGGIVVNYGTSDVGTGDDYMSIEEPSMDENANNVQPDRIVPTETPTPTPTQQVSDKAVATQDMEDAPAVTKTEKAVKNPAAETTKEVKNSTPTVNTNALYKGKKNNGQGAGDGEGGGAGNQGSALGDPLASNYGDGGSGFGNTMLSIENRRFVVPPVWPKCDGLPDGRLTIRFRVDRNGNVISANYSLNGSTITNGACIQACEQALRKARLNSLANAPDSQSGQITINFKSK